MQRYRILQLVFIGLFSFFLSGCGIFSGLKGDPNLTRGQMLSLPHEQANQAQQQAGDLSNKDKRKLQRKYSQSHYNQQSKEVRKRMRQTQRRAKRINKGKTPEPFAKPRQFFDKIF